MSHWNRWVQDLRLCRRTRRRVGTRRALLGSGRIMAGRRTLQRRASAGGAARCGSPRDFGGSGSVEARAPVSRASRAIGINFRENTKMLQMLQALCEHHKLAIARDPEIDAMARRTEVKEVLSELRQNMPAQE